MERVNFSGELSATVDADGLVLSGDLSRDNSRDLLEWMEGLSPISRMDLSELDIEDGVAATHAVNAVRMLCAQVSVLYLKGAPQVLAHNLYRTGLLAEGGIELVDMRQDEAYG